MGFPSRHSGWSDEARKKSAETRRKRQAGSVADRGVSPKFRELEKTYLQHRQENAPLVDQISALKTEAMRSQSLKDVRRLHSVLIKAKNSSLYAHPLERQWIKKDLSHTETLLGRLKGY